MRQLFYIWVCLLFTLTLLGQSDDNQFNNLVSKGKSLCISYPDSAMLLFQEALVLAENIQNKKLVLKARSEIAGQNYKDRNAELAKIQFLEILIDCDRAGLEYPYICTFTTHRLGHLYQDAGLPDSALYYYQLTIALDNKSDLMLSPDVRLSISDLYISLGKYEEAEFYLRENHELNHDSHNIYESLTIFSLAKLYLITENVDSFAKYNRIYLESINIESMGGAAQQYHYDAMFDGSSGKYNIDVLESTIPVLLKQAATYYVSAVYALLGEAYLAEGRYDEAYSASSEAYSILNSRTPDRLDLRRGILETMYQAEKASGHFEQALLFLIQIDSISDIVSSELSRARIDSLEIQFQSEQKESAILSQQIKINHRTNQRNLLIVVGATLLLLLLVLWQRLMTSRRLSAQNAIIKEQKIIALKKENKILAMDAMINGQEEERKRIAKDLHDGLGGILSTIKLRFEAIEKEIERLHAFQPYEKAITMLDGACDEVRRIAHDMMPAALAVGGLPDAIKDLGESLRDVHGIRTDVQIIGLNERLEENKEVMVYRILQELVANVIKHAAANKVIIQISQHDNQLMLIVEDDGVGFDPAEKSGGLGLKSLLSRTEYLNGELNIDSEPGHGATFSVVIPVSN